MKKTKVKKSVTTVEVEQNESTAKSAPPEYVPEKIGIDVLDSFLEQVGKMSFPKSEDEKVGRNTYYIGSIDHLLQTARLNRWDIGMRNEMPYFFTGKFWQRVEPQSFRHFLQAVGVKQGIPHRVIKDHLFVDKLVKQFESEARFPVLSASDTPKINLRNGTLHFTPNGTELKPFDKQDGLTYQLDYNFDPSATAPLFRKFLDRVLPDGAMQKLVFQYIGYVFLRDMKQDKILFLYGGGANGKSVFLNIIRALIGSEQCCEFSLEAITKSPHVRAELGKFLFNVSTEISSRLATDIFKKQACREPLDGRFLYGQPFIVRDYATSVFAMNELPKDVEQTEAFFRRFLIVPFDVRIPDREQDPSLAHKIIACEMGGILNYVVEGAKSLLSEQKFDIPEAVRGAVEKFRRESDSVLSFLDEGRYQPSSENWAPLRDMYDSYKEQCNDDNSRPVSKRTFGKRLRSLGYAVEKMGHDNQIVVFASQASSANW